MAPDRTAALAALERSVPASVRRVCEVLSGAGHRALTVGGAVRDALLGRVPGDWDVTTSALPDEVNALFRRTIPTGIEHGTITVIVGRGAEHMPIEVTTFRGDGAYTDARRPDEVIFGVSLEEDLARRDFVINAMAFDPIAGELVDPFGGYDDIDARVIRAVGVASERFAEDGLRVMRAVRFLSALEFELEPDTEAALRPAVPSLAKVARERVRVELFKLLAGPAAIRALEVAHRHGVLEAAVPLTAAINGAQAFARVSRVDADPPLRLAALLSGVAATAGLDAVEKALRDLTLSNGDRGRVMVALRHLETGERFEDGRLRRLLGSARRAAAPDLVALWKSMGVDELAARATRAETILAAGDALVTRDLAIRGKDVMDALDLAPGPRVGEILEAVMAAVHLDPSLNDREQLLVLVREIGA